MTSWTEILHVSSRTNQPDGMRNYAHEKSSLSTHQQLKRPNVRALRASCLASHHREVLLFLSRLVGVYNNPYTPGSPLTSPRVGSGRRTCVRRWRPSSWPTRFNPRDSTEKPRCRDLCPINLNAARHRSDTAPASCSDLYSLVLL